MLSQFLSFKMRYYLNIIMLIGFAFVGCKKKQDTSDQPIPQSADEQLKETNDHIHLVELESLNAETLNHLKKVLGKSKFQFILEKKSDKLFADKLVDMKKQLMLSTSADNSSQVRDDEPVVVAHSQASASLNLSSDDNVAAVVVPVVLGTVLVGGFGAKILASKSRKLPEPTVPSRIQQNWRQPGPEIPLPRNADIPTTPGRPRGPDVDDATAPNVPQRPVAEVIQAPRPRVLNINPSQARLARIQVHYPIKEGTDQVLGTFPRLSDDSNMIIVPLTREVDDALKANQEFAGIPASREIPNKWGQLKRAQFTNYRVLNQDQVSQLMRNDEFGPYVYQASQKLTGNVDPRVLTRKLPESGEFPVSENLVPGTKTSVDGAEAEFLGFDTNDFAYFKKDNDSILAQIPSNQLRERVDFNRFPPTINSAISSMKDGVVKHASPRMSQAINEVMSNKVITRGTKDLTAMEFAKLLRKEGHEVFVVGGAVRDIYNLNKAKPLAPKQEVAEALEDIDFTSTASPLQIENLIRKLESEGYQFQKNTQGSTFGIFTLGPRGTGLDVVSLRSHTDPDVGIPFFGKSLDFDGSNRDTTYNSIYYDPFQSVVFSPAKKAFDDLDNGVMRILGTHPSIIGRYFKSRLSGYLPDADGISFRKMDEMVSTESVKDLEDMFRRYTKKSKIKTHDQFVAWKERVDLSINFDGFSAATKTKLSKSLENLAEEIRVREQSFIRPNYLSGDIRQEGALLKSGEIQVGVRGRAEADRVKAREEIQRRFNTDQTKADNLIDLVEARFKQSKVTVNFDIGSFFYNKQKASGPLNYFDIPGRIEADPIHTIRREQVERSLFFGDGKAVPSVKLIDRNNAEVDFMTGGSGPKGIWNGNEIQDLIDNGGRVIRNFQEESKSFRPVYGALNYKDLPEGAAPFYGGGVIGLKSSVNGRTTLLGGDSFQELLDMRVLDTTADLGSFNNTSAVINHILKRDDGADQLSQIGFEIDKGQSLRQDYVEAHIHGGVNWADVEFIKVDAKEILDVSLQPGSPPVNIRSLSPQNQLEVLSRIKNNIEEFRAENPGINLEILNFP